MDEVIFAPLPLKKSPFIVSRGNDAFSEAEKEMNLTEFSVICLYEQILFLVSPSI